MKLLKTIALILIFDIVLLLVLSLLILKIPSLSEKTSLLTYSIGIMLFFFNGFFLALRTRNKGLLTGLINFLLLYGLIILIIVLIDDSFILRFNILKVVIFMITSLVGSILGVNVNKRN